MNTTRSRLFSLTTSALIGASLLCAGCTAPAHEKAQKDGKISVAVSFYPLAYLAEKIGGEHVTVTSITPANAEPHDFELSPTDIVRLEKTDALFYADGFQASLDEAVENLTGPRITDLASSVDLLPAGDSESEHNHSHSHESETDHEEEHSHSGHSASAAHLDPHFWLDTQRMKKAAEKITNELSAINNEYKADFEKNKIALDEELAQIDAAFSHELAQCAHREFITAHAAFGYLASRYNLEQIAISGIDPEGEPSPSDLARVAKIVKETHAKTIFTEALVSSKTSTALAKETGATTAVLDPLESQPENGDYASAMKENAHALATGLECTQESK